MEICKKKQIHNFCTPNALLTLREYLNNYASEKTYDVGRQLLIQEMDKLPQMRYYLLRQRLELLDKKGKVEFF